MVTGWSEYVHKNNYDDVDEHEDSGYKYNDTWINQAQPGQDSENSDGCQEGTTEPCEQEEFIELDNSDAFQEGQISCTFPYEGCNYDKVAHFLLKSVTIS